MNPLFVSHLVSDFLLQTKKLVVWKKKTLDGIIIHSSIHGIVLTLMLFKLTTLTALTILFVVVSHAIIDWAKINYQKENKFEKYYILDQMAHFGVLALASTFIQTPSYWTHEIGLGIGLLLFFISYFVAVKNLMKVPVFPPVKAKAENKRFFTINFGFLLFLIGALYL